MTRIRKTARSSALLHGLLFGAIGILIGVTLFRKGAPEEAERTAKESTEDAPRGKLYTCSMHPQVRTPDANEKCPICFMDLIPVPTDGAEEEGDLPRLRLSPRALALMEIRTWPVARKPVTLEARLFGTVALDESRVVDVVARAEGYVERLAVHTPWQPVRAGEVLADFFSPVWVSGLRELQAIREGAPDLVDAAKERLARLGVPSESAEQVLSGGPVPRNVPMTSPISGVALPSDLRAGEWMTEGARVVRLADLSRVWVHLEAYETELAGISEGSSVRMEVAALPGEYFEGVVSFLEPVVQAASRTVRLRVEAANSEGRLKPGMFVTATARSDYRRSGETPPAAGAMDFLVIPATAPLITGRRAVVYVRDPEADRPTFEPRTVMLGPRAGDEWVVLEGLHEGELVVVHGAFKIDSELQIRGKAGTMTSIGEPPQAGPPRIEGPQTMCPVMGGLIDKRYYADVEGYRIYVCCPGCDDIVREKGAAFLIEGRAQGVIFEKVGDE
ncbi:MAG: efflux RND transporter periplasmic adaptor subunit [Kiritimatiellia bacterium]|nr:efflux RND transporter periplasmic adaptor subunit [Kiritimatiellia bacterium]